MRKEKRFTFWGKRIKPDTYKKGEDEDGEEREDDNGKAKPSDFFSLFMVLVIFAGMTLFFIFIVPIMSNAIDGVNDMPIEEVYTIEIYIPDCDGEKIFTQAHVSGQYLLDMGLGTRKSLSRNELKPVINYQKWEEYCKQNFGSGIPNDNCCILFIKE